MDAQCMQNPLISEHQVLNHSKLRLQRPQQIPQTATLFWNARKINTDLRNNLCSPPNIKSSWKVFF